VRRSCHPIEEPYVTTIVAPPADAHVPVAEDALSVHRTAAGTTSYVRCSCGGFLVVVADASGVSRWISHAAGRD
jgi:hypothetical protein